MREIVKRVENVLDKMGYDYCDYFGCFDIAAKKGRKLILIKVLSNVDSIQEEQATSIKTISSNLDSTALIVGEKTRRQELEEDIIYNRFDIPTMSIETVENIFSHESKPLVIRRRGGFFVEIDAGLLKKKRQAHDLTQAKLAEKVGTTKKCIYEHEKTNKKAAQETAEKIESFLGKVSVPVSLEWYMESTNTKPKGSFESMVSRHFNSIGFETSHVYQAPFNIIAKSKEIMILSEAQENSEKIEKILSEMISFSKLVRKPIIAITKEEAELDIPTVRAKDLKNCSARDIKKLVKKW
ncbi:MAG: helix-turn-helix domain-containing protein [Candidatus Aenigmarchaeota archaeon]|nr:helix-turn-helix domain-containing protein [Candidatus Aenigmarchaeota archaeon]